MDTLEIILPVSLYPDYTEDPPSCLKVVLAEKDRVWINKMKNLVKKYDLEKVSAYPDTYPDYLKEDQDGVYQEYEHPIEGVKLNVSDTHFYWSAYLKHTDVRCISDFFYIKDLNKYFKFMKRPLGDMPKYITSEDQFLKDIAIQRLKEGV